MVRQAAVARAKAVIACRAHEGMRRRSAATPFRHAAQCKPALRQVESPCVALCAATVCRRVLWCGGVVQRVRGGGGGRAPATAPPPPPLPSSVPTVRRLHRGTGGIPNASQASAALQTHQPWG